jgi:hypothetical protein
MASRFLAMYGWDDPDFQEINERFKCFNFFPGVPARLEEYSGTAARAPGFPHRLSLG